MEPISKYGIILRLITVNDAEFIVNLWTNPLVSTFISEFVPTIDSQIKWLQNYKINEQLGIDYYFVAQDHNNNRYGTIRLYNIEEKSFLVGTWIFMPNSPLGMAVKTHIIALETGFELLNAEYCRLSVRKDNTSVLRYLDNFQPIKIKDDGFDIHFMLLKERFYNFKNKFSIFS